MASVPAAAEAPDSAAPDVAPVFSATDSDQARHFVHLRVLTLSGEEVVPLARYEGYQLLLDLKREIATRTGHPVALQLLMLSSGTVLEGDRRRFQTLGLEGEVSLNLIIRSPAIDSLKERFRANGSADGNDFQEIILTCATARELFLKAPPLLELEPPVVLAANLLGHLEQLNHILQSSGEPPETQYLFLGNQVHGSCRVFGRGRRTPDRMHLLRGKQDCATLSRLYGFYAECKQKLNVKAWKAFMNVFNVMPLAARIAQKIFCVHSGLSPHLDHLEQLRDLERPTDVPSDGLLCDLLWSSFEETEEGWGTKDEQLSITTVTFGSKVLETFLTRNHLEMMICSQGVPEEGYEWLKGGQLLSIFSASRSVQDFQNKGAIFKLNEDLQHEVSADYAQGQHQESSVLLRSQSRRLVARLGGVELLMKAMQRFTRNEPLQRSCCAALGQLANEVKEVDVEQKVVQLLMQALRAPPRAAGGTEASSCARYGAQALRHFATHGETKSFIARLGGIEELHDLALRGLQAPSTNQQLRAAATEALGALCHLASKHPENKLRIFEAGCLELAFQALGSSTTAPAETAEGVEASEATEVPEPELAMAACGLLHNMSVDAAIRSHVVKLGGRAAAERLAASHPEGAVRNLAMLLSKTLKPREEAAGDPFGALFAQRTPGLAAPRRVASKRERKIASEVKAAYAQAEEPR
ncbi:unnamed protein product [Durusdinium trenchii]|uniref:Ubiquitin-like domain-containing protein n=1 Tax=Durusdinium trenchii TaxID=1381693 RepID=A0ABP0SN31_9DINO